MSVDAAEDALATLGWKQRRKRAARAYASMSGSSLGKTYPASRPRPHSRIHPHETEAYGG